MILSDLQIELAGICNAHCGYCTWEKRTVGKQMMDTDLALRLLNEAKAMDVALVTYHGVGESLLHPKLLTILDHGEELGLQTRLSTNCFNLKSIRAEHIAKYRNLTLVLAIPWVEKPEFVDKCVQNALNYLRKPHGNRLIHIQMVCAEGCESYESRLLQEFLPYATEQVKIYFKQPRTWFNSDPVKGFMPKIIYPNMIADTFHTPVSLAKGCDMPERFLMILADGTIVPCCVGMDDWGLGNIKDRTLEEVWTSLEMGILRNKWRNADDSIPCGHCKKRTDTLQ